MKNILMNPWTITIIGGVIVGLLIYLVTKGISARIRPPSSDGNAGARRQHRIATGKKGRIQSGGGVQAGDKGSAHGTPGADRQHEIQVGDEGVVIAQGDVVSGDTRDSEGAKS